MNQFVTSQKGVDFIAGQEGCILKPYNDAVGYSTIGYGHLILLNEIEKYSKGITKAEAIELLKSDLRKSEKAITNLVKVNLMQYQFDALVSLVFNIGSGNLQKSTLLKKINELAKMDEIEIEWAKHCKAKGKVLLGLQRRRTAEMKMFKGG
jgi:GH24 family phage-related lysozyme (muramidase)